MAYMQAPTRGPRPQSQFVTNGPAIRILRDRAGYTLSAFADILGTDRSYLSRIERGLQQPGIALRNRIAKELGVTVDDIATLPAAA